MNFLIRGWSLSGKVPPEVLKYFCVRNSLTKTVDQIIKVGRQMVYDIFYKFWHNYAYTVYIKYIHINIIKAPKNSILKNAFKQWSFL